MENLPIPTTGRTTRHDHTDGIAGSTGLSDGMITAMKRRAILTVFLQGVKRAQGRTGQRCPA
jgi:hypothetical protein